MFQMKPKKCKKKINWTKLKNSDETKNWKKKSFSCNNFQTLCYYILEKF